MKTAYLYAALLAAVVGCPLYAASDVEALSDMDITIAPYLRKDAPVFNLTIEQFRGKFNQTHPEMALPDYNIIKMPNHPSPLVRVASQINQTLYSSAALDKSQRTIKSLQLTALALDETTQAEKINQALFIRYMAAFICQFDTVLSAENCASKAQELMKNGKGMTFYQQIEGTLRFVIADQAEKGITFAIEPIKLSLSYE